MAAALASATSGALRVNAASATAAAASTPEAKGTEPGWMVAGWVGDGGDWEIGGGRGGGQGASQTGMLE